VSIRFSRRLPAARAPNRLALLLRQRREADRPTLDLTETNPTAAGLQWPSSRLESLLVPETAGYRPTPRGLAAARQAVATDMGGGAGSRPAPDPGRVILTASTSEAYAYLFKLLCDPGDEILVPAPGYPLFEHLASLEAVRAVPYPITLEDRWRLEPSAVEAAITPRSRGVVMITPHNPTGWILSCREQEAMVRLAVERNLPLVADEVFADYVFEGSPHWQEDGAAGDAPAPPLALAGDEGLLFSLGGLSKGAGLPQMKIAWLVAGGGTGPVTAALDRLEWIADTQLSVATPQQLALPVWLSEAVTFRQKLRRRLQRNRRRLLAELNGRGGSRVLPSGGGWSAVLRLPAVRSDEEDCVALLEEYDLLVHPGYFFDFPAGTYLVVSLLPEPRVFAEGVKRLSAYLDVRSSA
jgi:aspartate/methionine/tyrosine aminotransferase